MAGLDPRAGEEGVLAQTTVREVVPEQGRALPRLAHARAEADFEQDSAAAALLLPAPTVADPDEEPAGADDPAEPARLGDSQQSAGPSDPVESTGPGHPAGPGRAQHSQQPAGLGDSQQSARPGHPAEPVAHRPAHDHVGFAGGPVVPPEVARDQPRQVDPGTVWVELDAVKVHAQPTTGRKPLLGDTTLVITARLAGHFAAATGVELAYQVRALLPVLGVQRDTRSLRVWAD